MSIPVAIAIVADRGRYLVGQRGPDGPLAGYFEFPGGKCHADETLAQCAARECLEETGLRVQVIRLRRQLLHSYPHGTVHLHFFDCELEPGTDPEQLPARFMWVSPEHLARYRFPQPNEPLIAELITCA